MEHPASWKNHGKKISKCYILEHNNYWEKPLYTVDHPASECWRSWTFLLLVQCRMTTVYVHNFGLHFQSLRSLCFVTHCRCALITELRPSVLDLTCMWLTRKRCQKDLTYRYCMICREILPSGWAVHWLSLIWALARGIKSKVRPWISYMYMYMCACHWISFVYQSNLSWCCIILFFVCFFLQSMPSERLRNQLTLMSTALHKAITKIQPEVIKVCKAFLMWSVCLLDTCVNSIGKLSAL